MIEYHNIGNSNEDNEFHITTLQLGSSRMRMNDYTFNKDKKYFEKKIIFDPKNVNLMHYSNY